MAESVRTIDQFLAVARKSELVDPSRLEAACSNWPDRSAPLPDELLESLIESGLLTRWQIDQLRKGKHKGFVLANKYRLLELLGAGGMSSVYLAEHAALHEKVAIKVLPTKHVGKTSYLARFEREARAAYRLSHPNIVRTVDLDVAGPIHFLAMEYVSGTDLHAKVKQDGPLDVRQAADFVRQAALGLHYAHGEGFVHRDIKPANLMLDRRGVVKILDFGLARGDDEEDSLTTDNNEKVLGTADYLSPEQAKDSHQADARSDIYALGCTLYFLLTGRPPFAKGSLAERIRAHLQEPPPNLPAERPEVPPAISEIYFRMLEKHPDARPQTAQHVADALAAWLASPSATPAGPAAMPRRTLPRRATTGDSGISGTRPAGGVARRSFAGGGSGVGGARVATPAAVGGPPLFKPAPSSAPGSAGRAPGPSNPGKKAAGEGGAGDGQAAARRPPRPRALMGLPLGFWAAALGGLALAAWLGYAVMTKGKKGGRGATTKKAVAADAKTPESDAAPAPKEGAEAAAPAASPAPPAAASAPPPEVVPPPSDGPLAKALFTKPEPEPEPAAAENPSPPKP